VAESSIVLPLSSGPVELSVPPPELVPLSGDPFGVVPLLLLLHPVQTLHVARATIDAEMRRRGVMLIA
jgi:hypothetical protein